MPPIDATEDEIKFIKNAVKVLSDSFDEQKIELDMQLTVLYNYISVLCLSYDIRPSEIILNFCHCYENTYKLNPVD